MKKTTLLTTMALGLVLLASQPAGAHWVHFSDSIFDALDEVIKHPSKVSRIITLPTDATGSVVEACIGYVSNLASGDRGKVTAKVTIIEPGGTEETVNLGGGVSRGVFGQCKMITSKPAGTIFVFDFKFKKFPRLRDRDRFQVAAAIAIDGANPFARQAGPLSQADQDGIVKMVEWVATGKGVALRRETSGWTVDWRIDGEGFDLGRTFKTIAAAIKAWCDLI